MVKVKRCVLCRKTINLIKDDYVRVTDFMHGEFFSESFYHNKCYRDRINKTTQMQKVAFGLANKANKLLNVASGKKEEVIYDIA